MDTPSSRLLAKVFLQHPEHLHLKHLTHRHKIINYFWYVDDILLIFDPNHTNIKAVLNDFNTIHPKLQLTAEVENNNTLNYLHVSIHTTPNNSKTSIYRKTTFTDTIIPHTNLTTPHSTNKQQSNSFSIY